MLRNTSGAVSGQKIADKLMVSRVAVWKQIKSLQELGYHIEGTPSGYYLNEQMDHLFSWEFEKEKENYHIYRELNSTMEIAREKAEENCDGFTTIVAEKQSSGKGRGNRTWLSNEGGLYFTMILRPELPSAYHYVYTLGATAVLSEIINRDFNIPVSAKWPNDILYKDLKICGILNEMHISGDSIKWLNLGVGINVNNPPPLESGTSFKAISGLDYDRKNLLFTFEEQYKKLLRENLPEQIRQKWKTGNYTINRKIHLKTSSGQSFSGIAEDIDATGALLIKDKQNKIKQALFGDIYLKQ